MRDAQSQCLRATGCKDRIRDTSPGRMALAQRFLEDVETAAV